MKTRYYFAIIAIILMYVTAGMCFAVDTVIRNTSFESTTPEGTPEYWISGGWFKEETVTKFGIDQKLAHSGKQSVFINNLSGNHSYYLQTVPVNENSYYKICGWIKTEKVGEALDGASLSLINKFENAGNIKGTSDWQYAELYVIVGAGISSIDVKLQLGNYGAENTGKAWFDDITIESVNDLPMDAAVVNLSGDGQTSGGGEQVEEQPPAGLFGSGSFTFILIAILIIVIVGIIVVILIISMKKKPAETADGEGPLAEDESEETPDSGEETDESDKDDEDDDEEP